MIAGDGYVYLVYHYTVSSAQITCQPQCVFGCSPDSLHIAWHSRLVRVATGGDSEEIDLGDSSEDWAVTALQDGFQISQVGQIPRPQRAQLLITNADQGILFRQFAPMDQYGALYTRTSENIVSSGCVDGTFNYQLIATSGASVTSRVTLPSNITYIEPDLQAQDGTYFGIVDYDFDEIDDFLAKFDASGNIQWAVPNYYAKMATADGGLIAQSADDSSTVTFDASGTSTGQVANLPQFPSWLGNGYQAKGRSIKFPPCRPIMPKHLLHSVAAISLPTELPSKKIHIHNSRSAPLRTLTLCVRMIPSW